jgi:hypothetical protein
MLRRGLLMGGSFDLPASVVKPGKGTMKRGVSFAANGTYADTFL